MEARLERAARSSEIDGEIGREMGGGVEGYDGTDIWARKAQVATLLRMWAEGRGDGRWREISRGRLRCDDGQ